MLVLRFIRTAHNTARLRLLYYRSRAACVPAAQPRPRTGNYEFTRFNALRHGVLSQHAVLPWEDGEEYRALFEALVAEHKPVGPTEEHLLEELAGVIWRKRRLRLGEAAAYHRALKRSTTASGDHKKEYLFVSSFGKSIPL